MLIVLHHHTSGHEFYYTLSYTVVVASGNDILCILSLYVTRELLVKSERNCVSCGEICLISCVRWIISLVWSLNKLMVACIQINSHSTMNMIAHQWLQSRFQVYQSWFVNTRTSFLSLIAHELNIGCLQSHFLSVIKSSPMLIWCVQLDSLSPLVANTPPVVQSTLMNYRHMQYSCNTQCTMNNIFTFWSPQTNTSNTLSLYHVTHVMGNFLPYLPSVTINWYVLILASLAITA